MSETESGNFVDNNCDQNYDSDEDDLSGYFMQSGCIYNIKEKVDEANKILFSEEIKVEKKCVVHFSIDLCEYEPDYSSSESVSEDMYENFEETAIIEEESVLSLQVSHLSLDQDNVPANSPVVEELTNEILDLALNSVPETVATEEVISPNTEDTESCAVNSDDNLHIPLCKYKKSKHRNHEIITCEKYCIDFTDIAENTFQECAGPAPTLKLHRTCCRNRDKQLLPFYNGHNSEYGLSKCQLETKQKFDERQAKKQKLKCIKKTMEQNRKSERNEEKFCEWLRDKMKPKVSNKQKRETCKIATRRAVHCGKNQNPLKRRKSKECVTCVLTLPRSVKGTNLNLEEIFPPKGVVHAKTRVFKIHFILST